MKRIYLIIYMAVAAATRLGAQPAAVFDREIHDFGTILWKNPVGATFNVTNRGTQPLIITEVATSCGCTEAEWTMTPIAAGETGSITVTFDAMQLGKFYKEAGIYCNASDKPVYLALTGTVATEVKNYDELFPHLIGNLHLSSRTADFGDVERGTVPTVELTLINMGETPYTPTLMHLPSFIKAEAVPETLGNKESGKIRFTLDSKRLKRDGWTNTTVYLARYPGDRVSEENELTLSATLLPDFSRLTPTQKLRQPKLQLSAPRADLGSMDGKKKLSQTILVTNAGTAALEISGLQVDNTAVSVNLKSNVLQPGETTKLKITVYAKHAPKGKTTAQVLLVTNTAEKPKTLIETTFQK